MAEKEKVLQVKDLRINFSTDNGYVQAVRGVSFDLYKGETLCIVGESGSGKSVTSKAIMGILAANGRIISGSIMYEGEDLTKVSEDEFHRIRGHKIGMIFQDPLSSLNPIMRIGKQITEAMLINSSHLKRKFNELTSDELVAYKNAETEYRSSVNSLKENIKFLKSEKRKELSKAKNMANNEITNRKYGLKQDYGSEVYRINSELDEAIHSAKLSLETSSISESQYQSRVEAAKHKADIALKSAKTKYEKQRQNVLDETSSIKETARNKAEEVKLSYDAKINEAKQVAKESYEPLKAKYKPIIKETKATYKAKCKVARVEVKEYKKELKNKYLEKVNEIKSQNLSKEEESKALKKAKSNYVSSIRITKAEAKARALKIMKEVGIPQPERRFRQYPFEFSGGMRQRIVIAIALTANPDVLICDEPTTALDVTIQAQILELINRLKAERNLSCIFITHDLGVVANMADRVAVMYAGKIVEYGLEDEIFYDPRHPYTWALLSSIPDIDSNEKLEAIPGTPPNMIYPPVGDAFALRSKYAMPIDFKKEPPLFKVSETHYAATWLLDPRAPKVEMPKIVKTRIENSLKANKKGGKKNA